MVSSMFSSKDSAQLAQRHPTDLIYYPPIPQATPMPRASPCGGQIFGSTPKRGHAALHQRRGQALLMGLHQRRGQAPSTGNFSDWFLINSSAISAAQFSHKHKNSKADPTHRWVGFTVIIVSVATMLAQTGLAQAPSQRDIILHSGGQYGPYHCHRLQPQATAKGTTTSPGHRAGHGPLLPTGPGTGKPQGLQNILAQVLIVAHVLQVLFHIGLVYHYLRTGHFWRVK